jgi:hypothetical protein
MSEGQALFNVFLVSFLVATVVAVFRWQLPGHHITPAFVVLGNLGIIAVAFPVLGPEDSIFLFKLNAVAAFWVCVEYYVSAWYARKRKERRQQERDF